MSKTVDIWITRDYYEGEDSEFYDIWLVKPIYNKDYGEWECANPESQDYTEMGTGICKGTLPKLGLRQFKGGPRGIHALQLTIKTAKK